MAMTAWQKRAGDLRAPADGMKFLTDIGNKPADDRAKLDALRASEVAGQSDQRITA